jgi:D-alanyl-D-alanine carboxypeptidase
MNELAKELHLTRTKFTDTSGLRGNVSTAREMALALRVALDDKVLRDIMADDYEQIVSRDGYSKIAYSTTNLPLLSRRHDVVGGKTGYTRKAGYCYITAAQFDHREVVMVFLGAREKLTRFGDFNRVSDWLERGAPGAKVSPKRPRRTVDSPKLDVEVRGRVAEP